jgi:nucleoside-diphosphate-sugar epimerase
LVTDSTKATGRALHEINVIGTMNLLAAAGQAGSPVRQVVVKSSTLVYGSNDTDPAWFSEETPRSKGAGSRVERSLIEVEDLVRNFAEDNPSTVVSLLRFANVLGTDIVTPISINLSRPLCPSIAGFDPLLQFVEEDDVVRALEHVTRRRIPGIYNVAGAGKLPWSEIAGLCGTRLVPLSALPQPVAASTLVRAADRPPAGDGESLLRYGRGVDTRRFATTGFSHRYRPPGRCRASSGPSVCGSDYRESASDLHLRARCRAVLPTLALGDRPRRQLAEPCPGRGRSRVLALDLGLPTVCNVRVDFSATDCVSRGFISDLYQICGLSHFETGQPLSASRP